MVTIVDRRTHTFGWVEAGSGELALFLHGLGGSRTSWTSQVSGLASLRRCVAWDMPGYGESAGSPTSLPELADAAAELITELGAESADIIGLSMGGMIAQHLAIRHPAMVRTLALLDTSPAFGLDGTTREEWLEARLNSINAGKQTSDIAPQVIGGIVGPQCSEQVITSAVASMVRIPTHSLVSACYALVDHDVRDRLAGITVPTQIIVGADDQETPVTYAQMLVDAIPGAHLAIIKDCGHLSNVEAPERVNQLIEQLWTSTEREAL